MENLGNAKELSKVLAAKGRMSHTKHSNGTEEWIYYDNDGNMIYDEIVESKRNDRSIFYYEYDGEGNCIYNKNYKEDDCIKSTMEEWFGYDEDNTCVYYKYNFINIYEHISYDEWYIRDEYGNMIKKFYSDDYKVTHTEYAYDQNGNLAYKKCSTILRYCHIEDLNEEYWYRYDENNRKVYCKYACWYSPDHNCEEWYIYDEHGDVVKELRYTKSGCECRMLNMPTMEFII